MPDIESFEHLLEKYQVADDLVASARVLGRFLDTVLKSQTDNKNVPYNTVSILKEELRCHAADSQPADFREAYLNFARNASYEHLPIAAEPLFEGVEAGRIEPNEAASLISTCIYVEMRIAGLKPYVQVSRMRRLP